MVLRNDYDWKQIVQFSVVGEVVEFYRQLSARWTKLGTSTVMYVTQVRQDKTKRNLPTEEPHSINYKHDR